MKIKLIVFALLISATVKSVAQVKNKDLLSQLTDSVKHPAFSGVHSILIARSSFKSITSLLMGIAVDKGFIKSTAQKMLD